MKNKQVFYNKSQVALWLRDRFAEIDWTPVINELPEVIWRSRWDAMRDRYGLPYSSTYMRKLDCQGIGPKSY